MSAADHLAELFEPLGGVSIRRMFGGLGVFRQGLMFALVANDVLYFKTDEETLPRFVAEECGPFVFGSKRGQVETSYRQAPERLYDEPDDFAEWAREAFAVALRTQKKPKGAARKKAAAKKPDEKSPAKKK